MKDIDVLIVNLRNQYNFSSDQIKNLMKKEDEICIPASILSDRRLGPLEACVKYLKEERKLKYSEIGEMLNRDERTIWVTYNNAKKKIK